jgi:xylan 1,4-beta-xylosidase
LPALLLLIGLIGSLVVSLPVRAAAEPHSASADAGPIPIEIQVDAGAPLGPVNPSWRFFGADEPNYAYMPNGRKLLSELGQLAPRSVYFRAHNLLTSGDGTPALKWGSTGVYSENSQGEAVYNWTILDRIFDTYLQEGLRPYVEIGFMPRELSTRPEPYQHHWNPELGYNEIFTGWAYPPRDYQRWSELVFQWTKHCLEKYGRAELENWYWEVWNEPNIGYWRGTPEEFLKLHDYAIAAVRRALPNARVGGADTAGSGGAFTRRFLEHCLRGTNYVSGQVGTPLDFISFHAKGAPTTVDNHVRMGIANQLRTIADGFRIVAEFPELKDKPIVIGESDPEGCAACKGPQLAYRNGTMYPSYTAAVFGRLDDLAAQFGVHLEGALTWAFEFENQPYFAGFRSLASNGIDKPILNLFRMLSRMTGRRLSLKSNGTVPMDVILKEGVRAQPDISALASLDQNKLCILAWHYHDDDLPGPAAQIALVLTGMPARSNSLRIQHFRIDENHSNAFTAWKRLGSPQQPTSEQRQELEIAGQLTPLSAPPSISFEGGQVRLEFLLPRQAVSLVELTWDSK